jgi:hypothetical protein
MDHRQLKDCALLIGYNPEGQCVYSAHMPLSDYWDGDHVWDTDTGVQDLRLERVHGCLFEPSGELLQEFESRFDISTGAYLSGWQRHSDGTYVTDAA